MQKRSSKNIQFNLKSETADRVFVKINSHLFAWVIENLLRNALDAMDGTGNISIQTEVDKNFLHIDVTDTGKGIPAKKVKKIFQPGFSTKKRGWGLGLSLSKRIISDYHKGKIFVKKTELNIGTTFRITLPYEGSVQ
jgi:signal transduction histidine kinase